MTRLLHIWLDYEVLREIRREARRQKRTQAWLLRTAWKLARDRVRQMPGREG